MLASLALASAQEAITNPYDYRYPCTKNATNHAQPGVDAAGNKYNISWDNCKYDTKTKYEEAEAAKKREGGCGDMTKIAVTILKNTISGHAHTVPTHGARHVSHAVSGLHVLIGDSHAVWSSTGAIDGAGC